MLASTISFKCPWVNRKGRFNNDIIMNIRMVLIVLWCRLITRRDIFYDSFCIFSSDINYRHFLATYADPFDLSIKIAALSKLRFPNAGLGVPFFSCKLYCAAEGGLIFFARAVPAAILCGWKGRQEPLNLL